MDQLAQTLHTQGSMLHPSCNIFDPWAVPKQVVEHRIKVLPCFTWVIRVTNWQHTGYVILWFCLRNIGWHLMCCPVKPSQQRQHICIWLPTDLHFCWPYMLHNRLMWKSRQWMGELGWVRSPCGWVCVFAGQGTCGLCRSTWGCVFWCNHFLGTGHDFWKKRCYRFHIISSLAWFWLIFCCSPQACKQALVLLEVLGSSITNMNFLVAHITLVTAIIIGFGVRWRQSCRHRQCVLWGHYEAESCGQVCWPMLAPKAPQYPFLRTNPCISFSGTIEPLVLVRLLCHKNARKVAFPKAFPPHWLRLPRHLLDAH